MAVFRLRRLTKASDYWSRDYILAEHDDGCDLPKMRALATYACATFLALFGAKADALGYEFGVGGKPLICVPEASVPDFNRSLTHSSLSLLPGDVPLELVIVHNDAVEITRAIPGFHINPGYRYNDSPNVMSATVYLITEKYKRTPEGAAAGPDAENIWNKAGACREPVIAKVPGSSAYLAKCDRGNFWHILFDRYPGADQRPHNVYDSVLAECTHTSVGFGPHKGAELESCTRRIVIDTFRIDYQFQVENERVIPQMDAFLRSKIDSWERNCGRK
jgi:hypothetical protein